ncbi:MAG: LLM class flavin-dependent oxidoreductase [Ardenticatenaceae bacterium]|nr:LLM class flavin-dependent oxidoreductase [Ardenticatenaceae bacterium]
MRVGVKPGQIGLSTQQLVCLWQEAEDAGFESVWTFDHLTGHWCYEAVTLLAAMAVVTRRVRSGCLVLAHGTRSVETLAAQVATIDALSGGRLEVGLGVGSVFAKQDFDALHLPFPAWSARLQAYQAAVDRLLALTAPTPHLERVPSSPPSHSFWVDARPQCVSSPSAVS